jgi:hypothetical protein
MAGPLVNFATPVLQLKESLSTITDQVFLALSSLNSTSDSVQAALKILQQVQEHITNGNLQPPKCALIIYIYFAGALTLQDKFDKTVLDELINHLRTAADTLVVTSKPKAMWVISNNFRIRADLSFEQDS